MGLTANNSPRNRKRNRVGIEKTRLIRKRGGEGARVHRVGAFLLAGEGSLALLWGGGPSTPALAHPSSPTRGRVEDTLAEQGHPSPERGRRAQKYSLGIFKDIIFFFPGGVATWERRREGKERLPSVPRTREKLDGEKERRQLGPQLPVAWTRPCAEEERCESLPKGRAAGP